MAPEEGGILAKEPAHLPHLCSPALPATAGSATRSSQGHAIKQRLLGHPAIIENRQAVHETSNLLRPPNNDVTAIRVDRHKVVTAVERYGEAPLRVWCARSGECLAALDSGLPAPPAPAAEEGGGGVEAGGSGEAGAGGGEPGAAAASQQEQAWEEHEEEEAATAHRRRQYNRGWEGVTALACRGALLVTGNSEGMLCERDFGAGGLQEEEEAAEGSGARGGKFWRYA